ncbi:MAG: hypothetical protein HOV68_17965 [Streptomycetaceae bacterium]|nr:hypothetical protein [Streptomycetaceae bacterium]
MAGGGAFRTRFHGAGVRGGGVLLAVLLAAGCSSGSSGSPPWAPGGGKPAAGPVPTEVFAPSELEDALLTPEDLGSGWSVDPYPDDDDNDDAAGEMLLNQCRPLRDMARSGADFMDDSGPDTETRLIAPGRLHDDDAPYDLDVSIFQDDKSSIDQQMTLLRRMFAECRSMHMDDDGVRINVKLRDATKGNLGDKTVTGMLTASAMGLQSTLKITTVSIGNTVVQVAGSPNLVDRYAARAVEKARTTLTSSSGASPSTT